MQNVCVQQNGEITELTGVVEMDGILCRVNRAIVQVRLHLLFLADLDRLCWFLSQNCAVGGVSTSIIFWNETWMFGMQFRSINKLGISVVLGSQEKLLLNHFHKSR